MKSDINKNDYSKYLTSFFKGYLRNERGCSHNTIQSYAFTFKLFDKFLRETTKWNHLTISLEDFDKSLILKFLDWLEKERKLSPASRNVRLAAMKSFFKYILNNNPQYIHICKDITSIYLKIKEDKIPSYLTEDGIKLLLQQPDYKKKVGLRNLALLALMYDSAARVQEIIDLTPKDLSFKKLPWVVLHGKGGKIRQVALSKNQKIYLQSYLQMYGLHKPENENHPLFFNSANEKLTRSGVSYILKQNLKKARQINPKQIPSGLSCHSLRHSRAIHLLENGVHIAHIRDILGHNSTTTTEKYARLGTSFKQKAIRKAYKNFTEGIKTQNQELDDDWLARFIDSLT
jgi:integrase/recombinase XerD